MGHCAFCVRPAILLAPLIKLFNCPIAPFMTFQLYTANIHNFLKMYLFPGLFYGWRLVPVAGRICGPCNAGDQRERPTRSPGATLRPHQRTYCCPFVPERCPGSSHFNTHVQWEWGRGTGRPGVGGQPTKTHRMRRPPHKTIIALRSWVGGPSGTEAGPHACPECGRSLWERPLKRGPTCGDGPLPQSAVTLRVARAAVTYGIKATLQGAPLVGTWL